jgi:hypothetical protein
MLLSFLKFAILATLGEVIGLRIRTGAFYRQGFGLLPRALVWGFLGMTIHMAFVIFSAGVPVFLENTGLNHAVSVMATKDLSMLKVLVAFSISVAMNVIYAPVMMTLHKITDTHIEKTGGTLRGFFSRMDVGTILAGINWQVHWRFFVASVIYAPVMNATQN